MYEFSDSSQLFSLLLSLLVRLELVFFSFLFLFPKFIKSIQLIAEDIGNPIDSNCTIPTALYLLTVS